MLTIFHLISYQASICESTNWSADKGRPAMFLQRKW